MYPDWKIMEEISRILTKNFVGADVVVMKYVVGFVKMNF